MKLVFGPKCNAVLLLVGEAKKALKKDGKSAKQELEFVEQVHFITSHAAAFLQLDLLLPGFIMIIIK